MSRNHLDRLDAVFEALGVLVDALARYGERNRKHGQQLSPSLSALMTLLPRWG